MAKIPGKGVPKTPAKPAAAKAGGGVNIPPAIRAAVRKLVREEVAKTTKPRG